jgi:hypothetical protein
VVTRSRRLQAYRAQRWGMALPLFQVALQEVPSDQPSQLYIQRCQEFQVTPPRDDWDGVLRCRQNEVSTLRRLRELSLLYATSYPSV